MKFPKRLLFSQTVAALCLAGLLGVAAANRVHALAAAPAAPSQDVFDKPYILSQDDQLSVTVMGHTNYNMTMTVLPDGTITYPVVGTVHAAGMTVDGLTKALTKGLGKVLNQPQVTVTIVQSRPLTVTVIGSVKTPGLYSYKPGWHVLDAIAAAGGLAQVPEMTSATLITDEGNKSVDLDLVDLLSGANLAQNPPIEPGDTLRIVTRDPSVALVQVRGEILKPGQYVVPAQGADVMSLLTQAGGPTTAAALTRVQILHKGEAQTINLRSSLNTLDPSAQSARVVAGDVLLVPTNNAKIAVLGEVKNPSIQVIPDGENITLVDALTMAGGLTDDSDRAKVAVVERTSNGKTTQKEFDLTKNVAANATDTQIQPGDVVFVPTRRKGRSATESYGLAALIASVARYL